MLTWNALKMSGLNLYLHELFSNSQHHWCIFRHDIYIFINKYKTRVLYIKRILRLSIHVLSQLILTFQLNCVLIPIMKKNTWSSANFYQFIYCAEESPTNWLTSTRKLKLLWKIHLNWKKLISYCNFYYWVFSFVHIKMSDDITWGHLFVYHTLEQLVCCLHLSFFLGIINNACMMN